MQANLKFSKHQFAQILEGKRDNDFQKQLSRSVWAAIESCFKKVLPVEWLKSMKTGRESFCIWEGTLGSPNFHLANIHRSNGFFATDFRLNIDVQKNVSSPITEISTSHGVDYTCDVSRFDDRVLSPKVSFKNMSRWDRHSAQFYSIRIPASLLPLSIKACRECSCPADVLRPITIAGSWFFPDWMCICCGQRYLCECSRGCLESECRRENYDTSRLLELSTQVKYRDEICHLCRGIPSETYFGSANNGGPIFQLYKPYIHQQCTLKNVGMREAENIVRDRLGVPRIGEGWVNEMMIINTVRHLFPELKVEHQASPPWLERQRYDAYIEEHRVAIEYNGAQHYNAVSLFGGRAGLKATQERDQKKLKASAAHNVEVVTFSFDDPLSEELIYMRVKSAIARQNNKIKEADHIT